MVNLKLDLSRNGLVGRMGLGDRYFGACTEYLKDRNQKLGEANNCLKADLVASKDMVIELKVSRPEEAGVYRVNQCKKK